MEGPDGSILVIIPRGRCGGSKTVLILTKSPTFIYHLEQKCAGTFNLATVNDGEFDIVTITLVVVMLQNDGEVAIEAFALNQITDFH